MLVISDDKIPGLSCSKINHSTDLYTYNSFCHIYAPQYWVIIGSDNGLAPVG